ncbi:MAG TPA: hypothetical protein VFY59_10845 [Rubrobacter sp.]|nr:hypothetical protein [Rubrobacter sp.]
MKANGGETMIIRSHHRTRWAVLLLAVALAVALVAYAWPAAQRADAADFKTVTKTLDKDGVIQIPGQFGSQIGPASPYPSGKLVSSFPQGSTILDVDLILRSFTHQSPAEIDVMLVHGITKRVVMGDAGSIFDVGDPIRLVLDDEAESKLPQNAQIVEGRYRPANYPTADPFDPPAPQVANGDTTPKLSGFDGKNPNGGWKLFVDDQFNTGTGVILDGWSLRVRAKVPTN